MKTMLYPNIEPKEYKVVSEKQIGNEYKIHTIRIENTPIPILFIDNINKDYKEYTTPEGLLNLPVIRFSLSIGIVRIWSFVSKEERDRIYDKILSEIGIEISLNFND